MPEGRQGIPPNRRSRSRSPSPIHRSETLVAYRRGRIPNSRFAGSVGRDQDLASGSHASSEPHQVESARKRTRREP